MSQAHVFVSGFVQGVGFRHFIRSKAKEIGLKGYIQNLPDGRVEALFQGPKEKIEAMIKHCKEGPFLSEVEEVSVNWEKEEKKFDSFDTL